MVGFILRQVIVNAIQYSIGKAKSIDIIGYVQEKKVILKITDHGIGILKQDLRRVFDLYFTGEKGVEYKESTGIG